MPGQLTVTYFHHSGFSVACGETLMIFDYWRGENRELDGSPALREEDLLGFRQVLFFISHEHPDHYDEVVYDFKHFNFVQYIIADDMPETAEGVRMAAGDKKTFGEAKVTAFPSTDLGVSFYVEIGGLHIFHAGDLNLWHWREESTLRQITQAENMYYEAVAPIVGLPIDLCMFPLDPRMGSMHAAGANHFIMTCKPRVFIPMHWQGRGEIASDFARRCRTKFTEGLALTRPRERAVITFEEHSINIHVYLTAEKEDMFRRRRRTENEDIVQQALRSLETGEPFSGTDLPVDSINDKADKRSTSHAAEKE